MKLATWMLFCILSVKGMNGQTTDVSKYVNNDSIQLLVLWESSDIEGGDCYSRYVMVMTSLDSIGKSLINDLCTEQWMLLLRNSKSDWATNVILYSFYEKAAFNFWTGLNSRNAWVEESREEDIAYWESFFGSL
jgi:hypothetical protein